MVDDITISITKSNKTKGKCEVYDLKEAIPNLF